MCTVVHVFECLLFQPRELFLCSPVATLCNGATVSLSEDQMIYLQKEGNTVNILNWFVVFAFQEVSRNPVLSEDDAAMLVAAHIKSKQPKNYGYYRVGAIRDLGGSHKLTPKMDPKLRVVRR